MCLPAGITSLRDVLRILHMVVIFVVSVFVIFVFVIDIFVFVITRRKISSIGPLKRR